MLAPGNNDDNVWLYDSEDSEPTSPRKRKRTDSTASDESTSDASHSTLSAVHRNVDGFEVNYNLQRARYTRQECQALFSPYDDEQLGMHKKRIARYCTRPPLEHFVDSPLNEAEISKRLKSIQRNYPTDHFPPLPDWYLRRNPPARNRYPWTPLPEGIQLHRDDASGPSETVFLALPPLLHENGPSSVASLQNAIATAPSTANSSAFIRIDLRREDCYTPQLPPVLHFPEDASQLQLAVGQKFESGFEECLRHVHLDQAGNSAQAVIDAGNEFADSYQSELMHFYYLATHLPSLLPKIEQLETVIIPTLTEQRAALHQRVNLLEDMLAKSRQMLSTVERHRDQAKTCLETISKTQSTQARIAQRLRQSITNAMYDVADKHNIMLPLDHVPSILPKVIPTVSITRATPIIAEQVGFKVGDMVYVDSRTPRASSASENVQLSPVSLSSNEIQKPTRIESILDRNLYRVIIDGQIQTVNVKKLSREPLLLKATVAARPLTR